MLAQNTVITQLEYEKKSVRYFCILIFVIVDNIGKSNQISETTLEEY